MDDPSNDLPRRATRAELEARLARAEMALRKLIEADDATDTYLMVTAVHMARAYFKEAE